MLDQFHTIMKIQILFSILCMLVLLTAGCTSSRPFIRDEEPKQETPKEDKHSLAEYEATLNPADYDQEVEVVEKAHVEEKKQQAPLEIPKDSLAVEEEVVQGFRIQVFSSSGVDEAMLMKDVATGKFIGDSVYMVYDAPVYKVRVGDFVNRYEASQRLPDFIEKGYRDAWIVPDRIIHRKFVHVSLPK
jgi:SPOR domain